MHVRPTHRTDTTLAGRLARLARPAGRRRAADAGTRGRVVVPVKELDFASLQLLARARSRNADETLVVHVSGDQHEALQFADEWAALGSATDGLALRVVVCAPWAVCRTLGEIVRAAAAAPRGPMTILINGHARTGQATMASAARRTLVRVARELDDVALTEVPAFGPR